MLKTLRILIVPLAIALTMLGVGSALAAGTGPYDAIFADGTPQTVAPHSSLWFKFGNGIEKVDLTVTLDASDPSAVRMGIYTPVEVKAWENGDKLAPVGAGGPSQDHTLSWSGVFKFRGTIYVVVFNDSDAPVSVQVLATGDYVITTDDQGLRPTPLPNPFAETTPIGTGIPGKLAVIDAQGGALYTVNGDGTNLARVSFGMDPQWNHAGTKIALARQGPIAGVYTVNADGSNERLLYGTNDPRAPDWSPDDSELVFSRHTLTKGGGQICFGGRCFGLPEDSQWKLALLATADGTYKDMPTTNHAYTPTWDRHSNTIVYNDTTLGLVKTAPEGDVSLEPFVGDLRPGLGTYDPLKILSPQFSPDGKQIVMMVGQPPTWQIALVNTDGSDRHLLTSMNPLDFTHANNVAPVWSPDGKQILFLSDRNGKWEIFVMNADGSHVLQELKEITDRIPLTYSFQGERMLSWTDK